MSNSGPGSDAATIAAAAIACVPVPLDVVLRAAEELARGDHAQREASDELNRCVPLALLIKCPA